MRSNTMLIVFGELRLIQGAHQAQRIVMAAAALRQQRGFHQPLRLVRFALIGA